MSVLDHPARRAILGFLRDGERSAGELAQLLGRPRSSVSHHLFALLDAGLVSCRQQGAMRFYVLRVPETLAAWGSWIEEARVGARGEAT